MANTFKNAAAAATGTSEVSVYTVPSSTTTPAYITQTRSQTFETTPRLCEIYRSEVLYLSRNSAIRSITFASTVTSSAVVGSSNSKRDGFDINAIAINTLCC